MSKIRVGVAGYGTIGQRLADGVAQQEDMELVGIADLGAHPVSESFERERHDRCQRREIQSVSG